MKRLTFRTASCLFSLALLLLSTFAVGSPNALANPKPLVDLHLTLGNPSEATNK